VDTNVLVFERIREEPATGADPEAVELGYRRAFRTVFDATPGSSGPVPVPIRTGPSRVSP